MYAILFLPLSIRPSVVGRPYHTWLDQSVPGKVCCKGCEDPQLFLRAILRRFKYESTDMRNGKECWLLHLGADTRSKEQLAQHQRTCATPKPGRTAPSVAFLPNPRSLFTPFTNNGLFSTAVEIYFRCVKYYKFAPANVNRIFNKQKSMSD